ncbi:MULTISPECIES: DNA replication/repair protein RecF [unclassified Granulicatella]|uniref:DNA replication/repair protein RecF n=1 Tax=unclassified Granulicatella TaxID=2630493 RepID=UPI001073EA61|nr:DNA replication/repair protein RecF [Granulicatella sp. WM01]MBF0780918.1 DNA replication/repair protein RecF [Granulicatella sp. 19428wC4_WM01]TFU93215.1 DNA replication/repair protein RecF [Granulicatella sp. WM01]
MKIKTLTLVHYRNYTKQLIEFSDGINIFLGQNAQGKTNLMEAIYFLSLTKSHRTSHDKEVIQWENDFARLEAVLQKKELIIPISLIVHQKGKKASIGHIEQKKLSHYISYVNVVLFAPEDLSLIKGAPHLRRRFIDMELGQMNTTYLAHLSEYKKIVKQRNSYLKGMQIDPIYFDVLTEELAKHAGALLYYRLQFIQKLEYYAFKITEHISMQQDKLSLVYDTPISIISEDTKESLIEKYLVIYRKNKHKEIEQRLTLYGPHREDFLMYINGKNAQMYASQGQQRTIALSLKLAEIDLFKEITGEYPILLLDDVLSELDDFRQTYLLKSIENKGQTFITTTNLAGIQKHIVQTPKVFNIEEGCVHVNG